ncbi:Bodo-specific multi-copy gene family, putative [Bodo saltans]|uniref:Bodo-specific multi-copy gene family, putative n=1 Tax=Bodo saltans TaxID=75058 RepID=A0A0S4JCB1_BODSA|nr:Bodo-specific multi-copy gene family, putative [Bodo saltans]|eukprot:CUG86805.1 Bodo-specific multi-copy gene family, putative [Bodo saltans]
MKDLEILVRAQVKPLLRNKVDVESYLRENLDPKSDSAEMLLQERAEQLDIADRWLRLTLGSEKRQVALCYSPQGSGKSQFVKSFVHEKRAEAMKCGRVIVRCCDVATQKKPQPSWLSHVLRDCNEHQRPANAHNSTDDGLCELVREHVEAVTGFTQDAFEYRDSRAAYAMWIKETARCFGFKEEIEDIEPLIMLDTCELLAEHKHHSHKHKSGVPNMLLEAFCLAMPSPKGRGLFSGCNAKFDEEFSLSMANVRDFGLLLPLTEKGFRNAIEQSLDCTIDENIVMPLFDVCEGQPRFLRLAVKPRSTNLGSADAFSEGFEALKKSVKPRLSADKKKKDKCFPYAYTCFLASSTKARVASDDVIVMNPAWASDAERTRTFEEAMTYSIGTYKIKKRFTVPPITFVDDVATKRGVPIPPSELHPFLKPEVVKRFRHADALERGRQFERPFMYAVYARYLLEFWKNASNPWVPLAKVFEGAVQTEITAKAQQM